MLLLSFVLDVVLESRCDVFVLIGRLAMDSESHLFNQPGVRGLDRPTQQLGAVMNAEIAPAGRFANEAPVSSRQPR